MSSQTLVPCSTNQPDYAEALRRAGAAPLRSMGLDSGMSLAIWENCRGEAIYERPSQHAFSFYIEAGQRTSRMVDGKAVSRGFPGAICLFPAQSQSAWRIEARFRFLHVYFRDSDLRHCVEQVWDREPAAVCLRERYQVEDPLLARAGGLLVASDWDGRGDRLALDHLLQWLMVQLVQNHSTKALAAPRTNGGLNRRQKQRLADFIEANLDRPLSLADLAAQANLSPWHFARLFRVSFGEPPHRYLLRRRLERARRKLVAGEEKILAVALDCGFADQSQFTRAFRRYFGVTPGQFRAGHR